MSHMTKQMAGPSLQTLELCDHQASVTSSLLGLSCPICKITGTHVDFQMVTLQGQAVS